MKEIEDRLLSLWYLLQNIPSECRGQENGENRHRYLKIKRAIDELMEN